MAVLSHLRPVINSLGLPQGVKVERRDGAGTDALRNPTRGVLTQMVFKPAVVQPASGRDLERLNSGDRSKGAIRVDVKEVFRTARESSGQEADVILFDEPTPTPAGILEGRYTVAKAADWQHVAGFTGVIAVKQESDVP